MDAEAVFSDIARVRDRPPPTDPSSAGCTASIVAIISIVLMPFIGRGFDLSGNVMAALGAGLALVALLGAVLGIFGGGFYRGALIVEVEKAIEETRRAYEAGDLDSARSTAVLLLDGAYVAYGPTTSEVFDAVEVAGQLGPALEYVEEVERILLAEGRIYPVFTARS